MEVRNSVKFPSFPPYALPFSLLTFSPRVTALLEYFEWTLNYTTHNISWFYASLFIHATNAKQLVVNFWY